MIETVPRAQREAGRSAPPAPARRDLGFASAAVVAAVYFIGAGRALDYDGSVTVGSFVRHGSLLGVFRTTYAFNNHPYFSFVEHVIWDLGGHSEAWLRVVPVLCGAAAVGLVTAWSSRQWGATVGVLCGGVVAANPMFAQLSRSVRGYSMMVLGCVAATLVLLSSRTRLRTMSNAQNVVYVTALGIAIGTQFYAILVLAAHVAILIAKGKFDLAWRRRSEVVLAIGVLPYAAMARSLILSTRARAGTFQPRFPLMAARELLGHQDIAVAILGALTLAAVANVAVRRRLGPATAAIGVELAIIWVVLHPFDLYPRFLVWLVPAVALAAGACVARSPRLAPLVAIAITAMVLAQASAWTSDPIASRQIARIVDDARSVGQRPCAAGYSTEVLLGYTRPVRSVQAVAELHGCDLVFGVVDSSSTLLEQFACHYAHLQTLPGLTQIAVLRTPRASVDPPECTDRRVGAGQPTSS